MFLQVLALYVTVTLLQSIEERRKNRAQREVNYQRKLRNKLAAKRRRDRARDHQRRDRQGVGMCSMFALFTSVCEISGLGSQKFQ